MSTRQTEELFDLVAPIAICGGADLLYEKKARVAWRKIRRMDPQAWKANGCRLPPVQIASIAGQNDFNRVYNDFALAAYDTLFETLVEEHGPSGLEQGHDYWGAKGYKLPHQGSRNFELSGDSCG